MATSVLAALWLVILGSRDGLAGPLASAELDRGHGRTYLPAFQARFCAAMKRLWCRYAIVSTDL
jgi:hypothetical protein